LTVKIVVDSLCDIAGDMVNELGITVVPVYVRFGEKVFKDRIEISTEEFYRRLVQSDVLPTTTQPTPADFLAVYEELAKETDEILVITLSHKLSGTNQSALLASDLMKNDKCRIEVIDSLQVIMGFGLIVIKAVEAVRNGADLEQAVAVVKNAMGRVNTVMSLDTVKYLAKGGRIGKAQGMVGSLLSVKPILTLKDGEVTPLTRVRTVKAGMDYLCNFVASIPKIEALAVEHATTPEEVDELVSSLDKFFPSDKIIRANVSPVIGTYVGPHVLAVSVMAAE
jgi:fatty acid kinase fatty acid binding subunit